jgi:uncharacterized protein YqgV (UPF0045/DUF77 family)
MRVTLEISNYPLSEEFEDKIIDFINRCKEHGFKLRVNATSTHVTGDYDEVMQMLQKEVRKSFEKYGKMIFVVKILKGELDIEFTL